MPDIVNPADALPSFIEAYKAGRLDVMTAWFTPDVILHVDHPAQNVRRLTYALLKAKRVVGIAQLVNNGYYHGHPAIDLGYAIVERHRRKGYGADLVANAIDEATEGFRESIPHLYLFAAVDKSNQASIALAKKIFDEEPESGTDRLSGTSVWTFRRRLF